MTKTASRPGPAPASPAPKPANQGKAKEKEKPKESLRDIVEQIAVAVLLAILIRGFVAEAFVIPTGSMAPTLKGRHKEIACGQCGFVFAVNSSEESEIGVDARTSRDELGLCVNCRFPNRIGDTPSFKGDRILVMKFPYELPKLPGSGGPDRWDVVVFHYPENPEQNYIKRLVGLPDEELRLLRGDVYTHPAGTNEPFQIARKSASKVESIAITVNDDRHRALDLKGDPKWLRWAGEGGFEEEKPGTFRVKPGGTNAPDAVLRYRHLVPDPAQWAAVAENRRLPHTPRATLITDFYAYNAANSPDSPAEIETAWLQTNWVGDLLIEATLDVEVSGGRVTFELVEAGVANRCAFDLSTGLATLFNGETKLGEAETRVDRLGKHSIRFANFDNRLTLWVDGRLPFEDGLAFDDGPISAGSPTAEDLVPASIDASEATVAVSDLVLKRDIYYTRNPHERSDEPIGPDGHSYVNAANPSGRFDRIVGTFDVLADPARFGRVFATAEPGRTYAITPDNFLMMGDNSPRSSDSRAWGKRDRSWDASDRASWEVPREELIGKAFFVYWPHGVPFGPDIRVSRDFRLPFRPYFERMKPIR